MSGELAGISGWELATLIDAVMGLPIVSEIWPSGERPSTHELLGELASEWPEYLPDLIEVDASEF